MEGSRFPTETELQMVARTLTMVNFQWKVQEVERIAPMQSGQSAGQRSTMTSATGGPECVMTDVRDDGGLSGPNF